MMKQFEGDNNMGRPRKKYKTYHISEPDEDKEIMEWFASQFNQSASVRQLIRMQIDDYGMTDLFSGGTFKRAEGQSGRATGSSTRIEDEIRKARDIVAGYVTDIDIEDDSTSSEMEETARKEPYKPAKKLPSKASNYSENGNSKPARKSGIMMGKNVLDNARGKQSAKAEKKPEKKPRKTENPDRARMLIEMMDI